MSCSPGTQASLRGADESRGAGSITGPTLGVGGDRAAAGSGAARPRVALRALGAAREQDRMEMWFAPFTHAERMQLLGADLEHDRHTPTPVAADPLTRMLLSDIDGWLVDNLLERGDRMTMAASVEMRPPYLDTDLATWAIGLDSRLKLRRGSQKWVLRQLAMRYLPPDVARRRKIGFKVPLDRWFRGAMLPIVRRALLGDDSFVAAELTRPAIERLVDRHVAGVSNEELRIWTLLSLEIWHRVSFQGDIDSLRLDEVARRGSTTTVISMRRP